MAELDPRDRGSVELLQLLIDRIAPEWKSGPNIVGLAPALKTTGGYVQADVLAIGFYVEEKVASELLADRGYRPIPADIEGVPTDVIVARGRPLGSVDTKSTRSQMFDTLVGGIAVGNGNINAYGTLGMTLLAVSDNRLVGLTNEHVLVYDVDGHVGDEVQQPRFYLNSEVSIDSASCCPGGQLHFRGVDNPIVDASVAVFASAALAAALSDEIDPHRRGQDATVPASGERTTREVVSVALDYPEIPFPGRPYRIGAQWKYQRVTDRRTMDHAANETKVNQHVLSVQELLTDKHTYAGGEIVKFVAILGDGTNGRACPDYFVTAAALSQSHQRAYKIILKPFELVQPDGRSLTHGALSHRVEDNGLRRCFGFERQKVGDRFQKPLTLEGLVYDPHGLTAEFVPAPPSAVLALRFPNIGLAVTFRRPVQRVVAQVLIQGDGDVKLTAYHNGTEVGVATAPPGANPADLAAAAPNISSIVLTGGSSESLLLQICVENRLRDYCLFRGELKLAPHEERGQWTTFLFAQTLNSVALGVDPTEAARTIGGLPLTDNFGDAGGSDSITYGHICNVDIVPNGAFEVV